MHKATKNPIKAPKSAQLNKNSSITSGSAKVGHKYTYTADDKTFLIEITDICGGDGRYYVPRCVAGKNGSQTADLDVTNGKLMVRKFTKAGAGQRKGTAPALVTSDRARLNAMKQPLRFWEESSGSLEVQRMKEGLYPRGYLVEQAIKYAGPEAAAKVAGTEEEEEEHCRRLLAKTSGLPVDLIATALGHTAEGQKASDPQHSTATQGAAAAAVVPTETERSNPAAAEAAVDLAAGGNTARQQDVAAASTAAETPAAEATDVPPASDQLAKSTAAAAGSEKSVKKSSTSAAASAAQRTLLNWLKK